jgi:hypothetical protein
VALEIAALTLVVTLVAIHAVTVALLVVIHAAQGLVAVKIALKIAAHVYLTLRFTLCVMAWTKRRWL